MCIRDSDRFGQLVDDAISKPELARQLLLLGYRAKDVQLPIGRAHV